MPSIYADAANMSFVARNIRTTATRLRESQMNTIRLINEMESDFRGVKITYLLSQSMQSIQKEYNKLFDSLLEYAKFLGEIAPEEYTGTDEAIRRAIEAFGITVLAGSGAAVPSPAPGGGSVPGGGTGGVPSIQFIPPRTVIIDGKPILLEPKDGQCASLVSEYYKKVYGMHIDGLHNINSHPNGGVVQVSTPAIGDIVRMPGRDVHWAVVIGVNPDGSVKILEQNWGNNKAPRDDRVISIDDSMALFRRS